MGWSNKAKKIRIKESQDQWFNRSLKSSNGIQDLLYEISELFIPLIYWTSMILQIESGILKYTTPE